MQIIENLILYGASVNTCDEKGATPLHLLAKRQVLKGQICKYRSFFFFKNLFC